MTGAAAACATWPAARRNSAASSCSPRRIPAPGWTGGDRSADVKASLITRPACRPAADRRGEAPQESCWLRGHDRWAGGRPGIWRPARSSATPRARRSSRPAAMRPGRSSGPRQVPSLWLGGQSRRSRTARTPSTRHASATISCPLPASSTWPSSVTTPFLTETTSWPRLVAWISCSILTVVFIAAVSFLGSDTPRGSQTTTVGARTTETNVPPRGDLRTIRPAGKWPACQRAGAVGSRRERDVGVQHRELPHEHHGVLRRLAARSGHGCRPVVRLRGKAQCAAGDDLRRDAEEVFVPVDRQGVGHLTGAADDGYVPAGLVLRAEVVGLERDDAVAHGGRELAADGSDDDVTAVKGEVDELHRGQCLPGVNDPAHANGRHQPQAFTSRQVLWVYAGVSHGIDSPWRGAGSLGNKVLIRRDGCRAPGRSARRTRRPGCGVPCRAWRTGPRRSSSRSSRPGTSARRSAGWSGPRRSAPGSCVPGQ